MARASNISLRCMALLLAIFSCTPAYTFSQKRGTAAMQVGCTSRKVICMSCGFRLMAN